jgi:hypothetical protein
VSGPSDHSSEDVIWFCQCATIEPGGFCAKHGIPLEIDRIRRKEAAEAFARLEKMASQVGWVEVERRVNR